jgi:hypothetical protein
MSETPFARWWNSTGNFNFTVAQENAERGRTERAFSFEETAVSYTIPYWGRPPEWYEGVCDIVWAIPPLPEDFR